MGFEADSLDLAKALVRMKTAAAAEVNCIPARSCCFVGIAERVSSQKETETERSFQVPVRTHYWMTAAAANCIPAQTNCFVGIAKEVHSQKEMGVVRSYQAQARTHYCQIVEKESSYQARAQIDLSSGIPAVDHYNQERMRSDLTVPRARLRMDIHPASPAVAGMREKEL